MHLRQSASLGLLIVCCVFGRIAAAAPKQATATPATHPAAQTAADLIEQLRSHDAKVRSAAMLRLKNGPGDWLPAIQAAVDQTNDADLKAQLSGLLPYYKARVRILAQDLAYRSWFERQLVEGYRKGGHADAKWDDAAIDGMRTWITVHMIAGATWEDRQRLGAKLKKAVDAGCDDPIVVYMNARLQYEAKGADSTVVTRPLLAAGNQLVEGKGALVGRYMLLKDYYKFLRQPASPPLKEMANLLPAVLEKANDPADRAPPIVADLIASPMYEQMVTFIPRTQSFETVERLLVKYFPDAVGLYALRANFWITYAWQARGDGFADTVTPEGAKAMHRRLEKAADFARAGWEKNPNDERCPRQMMVICRGDGLPREEMEKWFDRAVAANPDDQEIYIERLTYLRPRWHGTHEAMLEFGRKCLEEGNFRGHTALMLMRAHWMIAEDMDNPVAYVRQPKVWKDISTSYTKCLEVLPDDHEDRSYFARVCCDAGQWKEADRHFKILGEHAIMAPFGTPEAFMEYRFRAAEQAGTEAPPDTFRLPDGRVIEYTPKPGT